MESAIQLSCRDCAERPDRPFCDLPTDSLDVLDAIKSVARYPRGTVLFHQGKPSKNIFVLCEGKARISVCSEGNRKMTLCTANAGEALGLSACLAGGHHEVTAELTENSIVAVVKRKDLMEFLLHHREACMHVVRLLSQDLHGAYDRVRTLGLGRNRKPRSLSIQ